MHSLDAVNPVDALYRPLGHATQLLEAPVPVPYRPAAHGVATPFVHVDLRRTTTPVNQAMTVHCCTHDE